MDVALSLDKYQSSQHRSFKQLVEVPNNKAHSDNSLMMEVGNMARNTDCKQCGALNQSILYAIFLAPRNSLKEFKSNILLSRKLSYCAENFAYFV